MADNYEAWRRDWRARFCSMDHGALQRKLPFLEVDDRWVTVPYFNQPCAISRTDGAITAPAGLKSFSLYDELNIFTMLWYSRDNARLTGEWLPFESLRSARPYGPAFRSGNLKPLAATFSGHGDALREALLAFGGRKLPTGDVGYEIDVFPCIPMRVLFWEGDDEFPAQANLLFDRSAPDFIHVESVVTIASAALRHLAEYAGLPIRE